MAAATISFNSRCEIGIDSETRAPFRSAKRDARSCSSARPRATVRHRHYRATWLVVVAAGFGASASMKNSIIRSS